MNARDANKEAARISAEARLIRARSDLAVAKMAEQAIKRMQDRQGRHAFMGSAVAGVGAQNKFRNATRSRIRPGNYPDSGSSIARMPAYNVDAVRRESRDQRQNNWLARAVIKRACDLKIGDGGVFEATTDDQDWNRQAQEMIVEFCELVRPEVLGWPEVRQRLTFWQLVRQLEQVAGTDGDQLLIWRKQGEGVTLQQIESERIVSPGGIDTLDIMSGVETNNEGATVAYHVAPWHTGQTAVNLGAVRRIDASSCIWWQNPLDNDTNAVRGEPGLQSLLDRIEFLDTYIENVGLAAEIATRFGAVITSSRPAQMQLALESATEDQPSVDVGRPKQIDLPQAAIMFLKEGDKVEQLKPEQPHQNARDFSVFQMACIFADYGVPPAAVLYDASGLSWGNIKALLALASPGFRVSQDGHIAGYIRRVFNRKLVEWMERGLLPRNDQYWRNHITLPSVPVLDFASEVAGYIEAINANLMTKHQVVQILTGNRFDAVVRVRARETQLERELDVVPVAAPGAKPAQAQGGPDAAMANGGGGGGDPPAGGGAGAGGDSSGSNPADQPAA